MPAIASRVHSLQLGKAAEASTVLAPNSPFSSRVLQADKCSPCLSALCVVLLHHHIDSDSTRAQLFAKAGKVTHYQTAFSSHASSNFTKHSSGLHNLHFRFSKARRPAEVNHGEYRKRQRRVITQALHSSVRRNLHLLPSSFPQSRHAEVDFSEHRKRQQGVKTQAVRSSALHNLHRSSFSQTKQAEVGFSAHRKRQQGLKTQAVCSPVHRNSHLPPSSFSRRRHAAPNFGELRKRQRGVTTQAVRVEDLSPAAPTPDEEEPVEIKVPVGFVGETSDTVFAVRKLLPQPSILLTVTLPKPLGIVFEESRIRKRVTVAELVPGGNAERLARVVQMFGSVTRATREGSPVRTVAAVQVGDVLRGLTTTQCIVDLFGVRAPRRATVYFDTQNRRWGEIMGAFGAVKVSDGEITLVLERRL